MYVNDIKIEITDKGYKCYFTMPNRVGGMCMPPATVDWFCRWIERYKCKSYLEIGSFDGVMISILAEKYPNLTCYSIDPFMAAESTGGGHYEYFYINNKDFDNVYLFMDKSENVFPKLIQRELEFDLIFIDGDHSYSACKLDLENSFKLLSVGGFVVLDDAFRPPVIQAIGEFEVLGHKCFCNPHGDCITFSDWRGVGIPMFRREK